MLCKAAGRLGLAVESLGADGLDLKISGAGAARIKHEEGLHKFVTSSGKGGRRHTSFCKIESWTLPPPAARIAESDVEFKAQKVGGPGRQHVNKTESAIRATHKPTGIGVLCSSERSQFENKRIAMEWLAAKIERQANDRQSDGRRSAWRESTRAGGGQALRSYSLDDDRCVDSRCGGRLGAQAVLAGGCVDLWPA